MISQTVVENSEHGLLLVSTVWLPAPMGEFFETMIFLARYNDDGQPEITEYMELACERDYDRDEAIETHMNLVREWNR